MSGGAPRDPVALRRELHRHPELSGCEAGTAERVAAWLRDLGAHEVVAGLGGHGVAGVFRGATPGPTVLLRAELDALPIAEDHGPEWRSTRAGVSHRCGHDGHMAALLAVAAELGAAPPIRGRVVCLFQPAEEDGQGAARVATDPAFAPLMPDWAFAFHNLPGRPLGEVSCRAGSFTCASRGLALRLHGSPSHAAHPEDGRSPAAAIAELITQLPELPRQHLEGAFGLATVVHARLGEGPAFGTSPGEGAVFATLRAATDEAMERLAAAAVELGETRAADFGLGCAVEWHDVFHAGVNDAQAVAVLRRASEGVGLPWHEMSTPHRWSEDFGRLCPGARCAQLTLGSGVEHPALHTTDYDFPDALLARGADLWRAVLDDLDLFKPSPKGIRSDSD